MSSPDWCPVCLTPGCAHHDRAYWRAVAVEEHKRMSQEQQRIDQEQRERKAEADRVAAIATAPADVPVLLQHAALPVEDGLLIEGVATTRLWDENPNRRGRLPRKMVHALPVPVLWRHEWDKPVGTMYEASATADVLYFRAVVVPPGTPGYDGDLLRRVWDDIGSEVVRGVSFAAKNIKSDGSWEPTELSVCPKGAHPCATITSAIFPGGPVIGWARERFNPELVRRANAEFYAAHKRIREQAKTLQRATIPATVAAVGTRAADGSDGVALRTYRFVWKQGETYTRGDVVTDQGAAWLCLEPGPDRPGKSRAWRLISKTDLPQQSEAA